jgi:hypothetical protein
MNNLVLSGSQSEFDAYPYILLNLALSTLASIKARRLRPYTVDPETIVQSLAGKPKELQVWIISHLQYT